MSKVLKEGMFTYIKLDQKDCRGRNGWFKSRSMSVRWHGREAVAIVDVRSRSYGGFPPIYLELSLSDATALRDVLDEVVNGKEAPDAR